MVVYEEIFINGCRVYYLTRTPLVDKICLVTTSKLCVHLGLGARRAANLILLSLTTLFSLFSPFAAASMVSASSSSGKTPSSSCVDHVHRNREARCRHHEEHAVDSCFMESPSKIYTSASAARNES